MKRFGFRVSAPHNLVLCCARYVGTPGPCTYPPRTARCKPNQPILGHMRFRKNVINRLSSGHFQFAFAISKAWPSQLKNPSYSCHIANSHSSFGPFSAVCSMAPRSRRNSASISAAIKD